MPNPHPRKSGQAIIFMMVVLVIGILAVVWNFDLHRVISAKLRMRNAGDSAAMAAARWQGHALNMIGDLNLIQAAILSLDYASTTNFPYIVSPEVLEISDALHELRLRIEFVGPMAAFAVAQQTAFNNGALPDPALSSNLVVLAEELRDKIDDQRYDNAFDEYADLLEDLAVRGVAVSSYALRLRRHPLTDEKFYGAIAQAAASWWCPMHDYRYHLESYEGFESWGKLDTEFRHAFFFDLHLDEFTVDASANIPGISVPDIDEFFTELSGYLSENEVIEDFGDPGYVASGMQEGLNISWHIYDNSWATRWPRPTYYNDETDERGGRFPLRDPVRAKYNYLGAVAGIAMSAEVGRGILSSTDNETVDLTYRAKAKPFGFLNLDGGQEPPYYFGFVFPCFEDVRLVHSDIGDKVLSGIFYEHITQHLEPYLESGTEACNDQCSYCRLLVAWEDLDRQEGLEWLERAYNDEDNNPCHPEVDEESLFWGEAEGGASGGS